MDAHCFSDRGTSLLAECLLESLLLHLKVTFDETISNSRGSLFCWCDDWSQSGAKVVVTKMMVTNLTQSGAKVV